VKCTFGSVACYRNPGFEASRTSKTESLHGFVAMKLADALWLGGDPEADFVRGLGAVLPQGVAHARPSAAQGAHSP